LFDSVGRRFVLVRDVAMLAFITLLVVARSLHRDAVVDVSLWDETLYLRTGVELLTAGLPTPDWAPLFAIWYWLESLFIPDRIALNYANWSLLLGANLTAAWLIMRRLGVASSLAVVILTVLAFTIAFSGSVSVCMLASALVGFAAAVALSRKTLTGAFSAAASTFAMAAFVRPELGVAFGVLFAVAVVAAIVERSMRCLAAPVLVALGALLLFGNPVSAGRSFHAFGQHYARQVDAALPQDQRLRDAGADWDRFVVADFGDVDTVGGALRANPAAFFWHVGRNARSLLAVLATPVTPDVHGGSVIGWGLFLAIVGGIVAAARRRDRTVLVLGVVAGSALLAEAGGALLVFPNTNYFTVPLLSVLAVALTGVRSWRPRRDTALSVVAAALLLATIPGQTRAAPWYLPAAELPELPGHSVARNVQRTFAASSRIFPVLTDYPHMGVYSVNWVINPIIPGRCPTLGQCLPYLGAIIVGPEVVQYYTTRHDPLLPLLLTDSSSLGFSDRRVLGPSVFLAARTGLFVPPQTGSPGGGEVRP
jgi:hypothetical protein